MGNYKINKVQTKHRLGQLERAAKIDYSNCWNPLEPLKLQQ